MSEHDRVDDVVERLVRLADSGPEIPADGAARIKTAVAPLWRTEVRERARRRRLLWGAGALAAAAIISFAIRVIPRADLTTPVVERTVARFERGGDIAAGSPVRTDSVSRAAIRLNGGQSLRLDLNTHVRLLSSRIVELDRGAVYVDSENPNTVPVEIRTRFGIVRDIGTQFEVRSEDSLTLRVREGTVSFSTGPETIEIPGGTSLAIARDGSRVSTAISPDAQEWKWVQTVAPAFAIEGRTVTALLEWVARETGTRVRYESADAEKMARTAVLHGTLGDLRPAQAPGVILPTAGLHATREGSVLKVGLFKGEQP